MGERIRAFNWNRTPIGPLANWPLSLRVAVELCLNSRFPMFVWWGPHLINIYNDAYAPMMGTRHPMGLGASARDLWREAWSDIGPQTDAVLLHGQSTWNERRLLMLKRNGYPEECYFTWSYSPILDESGRAGGLFCAVTEETARILAERERDQLAQRYQLHSRRFEKMLDSITDLAFVFNLEGKFIYANKRLLEIRGVGLEQMVGKNFYDSGYPPELAAKLQGQIQQVIRTRQPVVDETSFTDRRGYTGFYQYVYSPVMDVNGQVEAVVGVTRELTERLKLEQALKENEEFHRFAAEAGKTGSWKADMATMAAVFSPTMCQLLGLPAVKTTIAFEKWFDFVTPEHRAPMQAAIDSSIQYGVPYDFEFQITRADGATRWLASRGGVVRDAAGKAVGLHGATVDITDKRKMAEERERLLESERAARAQAEHASLAKDKFLAVLSHELRTPLSPVLMTIPAIESDPQLPQRFRIDLAMVRRNIELEVKLIDDLLDLSRVTTGKLRLQMQVVNVHELLLHMIHSSHADLVAKHLHLTAQLDAKINRVMGDPARLQQVFWNLLRNAIKFTPDHGKITIRSFNTPDVTGSSRVTVELQDNGIGIAPEILPRVFDAFEQGDTRTTRQFGGLGLGLAISKALVEMHAGTISAGSGGHLQGSVFRVELATETQMADSSPTVPVTPPSQRTSDALPSVLLVEDHDDTSKTMARLLKTEGYTVAIAQTVTSALAMLDTHRFDIIVSDIGLPDATGYELMRQAKNRHGVTGIALSGYGMEEDIRKSIEAGFTEHLVKPIHITQLLEILRRITAKT